MSHRKPAILALLCVLLAPCVLAQEPATEASALSPENPIRPQNPIELQIQTTRRLTIQEAVDAAVGRSPQILIARLQVEQAKARVRENEAALYPSFTFTSTYNFNQSASAKSSQAVNADTGSDSSTAAPLTPPTPPDLTTAEFLIPGISEYFADLDTFLTDVSASTTNIDTGSFNNSSTDNSTLSGGLRMDWTVFSFGATQGVIRASQADLRSGQLELDRQIQELKLTVITSYYNFQLQNSNVEIAESALRNAEASLKDAQAREQAGVGTRFDVLRSEVQVANAQQQVLSSRNQARVAQRDLARVLNFATPTEVTVEEQIAQGTTWELGLEESIFRALSNRSELEQQVAALQSAEASEQASRASLLPSLTFSATYDLFNNLNESVGIKDGYSVSATLRWNFYDGGAANARAEQSRRNAQIAQVRFIDAKNTIRLDVESSYFTLSSSSEQIISARKGVDLAEESLRLARLRFRAGVGTQTDVIAAEDDLTEARANLSQAVITYNRSLAELQRALNLL